MTQIEFPMVSSDQIKFVRGLLGTRYVLNSEDPSKGLDCWTATRLIQEKCFGRVLPRIAIQSADPRSYIKAVLEGEALLNWQRIETPVHGCIVELVRGTVPNHVGTYFEIPEFKVHGLVHCLNGAGMVFDPIMTLHAAGWRRFTYNVPRNS